jgi:transcription antitermination factor NusA-like protein
VKLASKLVGWHIEVRAEGQVEDALKRAEGLFTKKPEDIPAEVPPPEGELSEASPPEGTEVGAKEGDAAEAPPTEGMDNDAKADEPAKE